MQQTTGIIEHHARLLAFLREGRDELTDTPVAPVKDRRVMVVADMLIIHHLLEVADDGGRAEVVSSRGNQRLMHVQRDRKRALHASKIDAALREIYPPSSVDRGRNLVFGAADVG